MEALGKIAREISAEMLIGPWTSFGTHDDMWEDDEDGESVARNALGRLYDPRTLRNIRSSGLIVGSSRSGGRGISGGYTAKLGMPRA